MFYALSVGLVKKVAYPLNPHYLEQQGNIQEKQEAMNQRPWMKQCCLWGEKSLTISHTHFNQREGKKGNPHREQEKGKKPEESWN